MHNQAPWLVVLPSPGGEKEPDWGAQGAIAPPPPSEWGTEWALRPACLPQDSVLAFLPAKDGAAPPQAPVPLVPEPKTAHTPFLLRVPCWQDPPSLSLSPLFNP